MSTSKKNGKTTPKKSTEHIIPIIIESDSSTDVDDQKPSSSGNETQVLESDGSFVEKKLTVELGELNMSTEEISNEDSKIIDLQQTLPPYNVPEKIIIVLDRARDEVFSYFELKNGNRYRPLEMIKNALIFFLHNKNFIDEKHEYALMVLNESTASWVLDFTNKTSKVMKAMNDIRECETEDVFDMNSVFDLICKKVNVPEVRDELLIPPPYVVRTVFIYGRSITMPEISLTEEIIKILRSPYFTFDVAMTHETPDSSNKCNLIFKKLQELDSKGFAYFFPVSRSSSELHLAMAKLLCHPLQRSLQKAANYK